MKISVLLIAALFFFTVKHLAQTGGFDVFTYQAPEFFTKSELAPRVQFNMVHTDGNFCTITLYKSLPANDEAIQDVIYQWNEQVVRRLSKATNKPVKIMTGQYLDGWEYTLAIGNFYQNKKKCVAMLHSFRKNKITACAVFAFSDKLFKGPVELFSKNLHLINQP